MKGVQLFLKPEEQKFLLMAVTDCIELLQGAKNQKLNWKPEVRKDLKDMLAAGESLKIKMKNVGFDMRPMPKVDDKDMDEYFTQPS